MPFEPRLISDDRDDLDLPDDLLILAEQLTADADRLAAVYPVDQRERSPAIAAAAAPRVWPKFNWRRIAGAAAIVAAAGLGGWAAFGSRDGANQREDFAPLRANAVVAEHPKPSSGTTVSANIAGGMPVMSSGQFQDLTGPEQEAVLDLLETDSGQPASLSI